MTPRILTSALSDPIPEDFRPHPSLLGELEDRIIYYEPGEVDPDEIADFFRVNRVTLEQSGGLNRCIREFYLAKFFATLEDRGNFAYVVDLHEVFAGEEKQAGEYLFAPQGVGWNVYQGEEKTARNSMGRLNKVVLVGHQEDTWVISARPLSAKGYERTAVDSLARHKRILNEVFPEKERCYLVAYTLKSWGKDMTHQHDDRTKVWRFLNHSKRHAALVVNVPEETLTAQAEEAYACLER